MMATKQLATVLDAMTEEVALVKADSSMVAEFNASVRAFFTRARALELTAQANLQKAELVKPPTTMQQDEAIQFLIKNIGADKKDAIDHWEITLKLSRFHKRLVAARKRSEEPNELAIGKLTTLHNEWVEKEKRRVAAENERLRRQAEEKARQDRLAELAEMERRATEAEEAATELSAREQQFVNVYMSTGNASQAAHVAGYKDPVKQGARLLALPKILAACDAKKRAEVIREQAAAVKETPLDVQVETVKEQISTAGGHDRSTHSAEILNGRLFIEAVLGGQYGIPTDVLTVDQAKLSEYARSLRELINRWPGVKHVRKTSLV